MKSVIALSIMTIFLKNAYLNFKSPYNYKTLSALSVISLILFLPSSSQLVFSTFLLNILILEISRRQLSFTSFQDIFKYISSISITTKSISFSIIATMYLEPTLKIIFAGYNRFLVIAFLSALIYEISSILFNRQFHQKYEADIESFRTGLALYKYYLAAYEFMKIAFIITVLQFWDTLLSHHQNEMLALYLITIHISANVILTLLYKIVDSHKKFKSQLDTIDVNYANYDHVVQTNDRLLKKRHDYLHHLSCLHGLIHHEALDEGKEYIEKILCDNTLSMEYIISDPVINSVLSKRKAVALDTLDKMTFKVTPFEINVLNQFDLGILLGNVLDNAIEASQNSHERYFTFEMMKEEDHIIIKVINTVDTLPQSFLARPLRFTTKSDKKNHGYGMSIIREKVALLNGTLHYKELDDKIITYITLLDQQHGLKDSANESPFIQVNTSLQ